MFPTPPLRRPGLHTQLREPWTRTEDQGGEAGARVVVLRHFEGMACMCPCQRRGWEASEPGEPAHTPPPGTWMRRLWQMLQIFTASGYVSRMYCSISRMARLCRVNSPSFCRTEQDAAVSQPLACRPLPRPVGPRPRKPSRAGRPSHCRFPPADRCPRWPLGRPARQENLGQDQKGAEVRLPAPLALHLTCTTHA